MTNKFYSIEATQIPEGWIVSINCGMTKINELMNVYSSRNNALIAGKQTLQAALKSMRD